MARKKKSSKRPKKAHKKPTSKKTKRAAKPSSKKTTKRAAKKQELGSRAFIPESVAAEAVAQTSTLGDVAATQIVVDCAGVTDTTAKLGDIGLDLRIFQNCVKNGVVSAGFTPTGIPAFSSNTLEDVIDAIAKSRP